jgi:hypothetical protein
MDGEAVRRGNGAWEIVLVRRPADPTAAWPDRYVKLFLLWSAAIAVSVALYVFVGYVWGSVATAAFLVAGCWITCCYYLKAARPEPTTTPLPADNAAVPALGQVNGSAGVGLSQAEVEAIPVFEYRRKAAAAAEPCAVCINAVRDGEAVRRLPACAHTFHAPCVDGWLRGCARTPPARDVPCRRQGRCCGASCRQCGFSVPCRRCRCTKLLVSMCN